MLAAGAQGLFGQLLYVANGGERTIAAYVYSQESGALSEIRPRVAPAGTPTFVAAHPGGKFLLALTAGPPALVTYSINPDTGALAQAGSSALPAGSNPQQVAVDSSGRFAAVAHPGLAGLSVFSIDPSTGATAAIASSPFATSAQPSVVAIHPAGFVYVATNAAPGQIAAFDLNKGVTAVSGSPFAGRMGVQGMVIDAAGKFLFVVERQDPGVLVFAIDSTTGALTPVAGSPFLVPNSFLTGIAVDPAGRFAYVSNGGGVIHQFAIAGSGALTPRGFTPALSGASTVIMDPKGRFVYVPAGTTVPTVVTANGISAYAVNPDTGALTPRGDPLFVGENAAPTRGVAVLLDPPVIPTPSLNSVTNFYSHAPAGMPNAAIAQGSRIALSGTNIGPFPEVSSDFPLRTELGGVSVRIRSGDVTIDALMVYASSGFVNAVVPSSTPPGPATVTLTYDGRSTAPLPVTIVKTSVGIRSSNDRDLRGGGTGLGPSVAWNVPPGIEIRPDPALVQVPNTVNQPARPGQTIVIQATGLGPIAADETSAELLLPLDTPAEVIIGNKTVPAVLAVRAAYGQDFIGFTLPADVLEGCYVPVAVRAGGFVSNVVSVSISASGSSCSDPHGLTASDLEAAQASKGLNIGVIQLTRLGFGDQVSARFARIGIDDLRASSGPVWANDGIRGSFAMPPAGSCTVTTGSPSIDLFEIPQDPTPSQSLNAGPALTLNGPKGQFRLPAPFYQYDADGEDILTPGDYTVDNGAGTQTTGSFKGALTLPEPVKWTNKDSLATVDRSQDLTFTWTGGLADKEIAMIAGLAQNEKVTAAFLCTEKVSAGSFTVPAWVLSNLPASAFLTEDGQTIPGGLLILATTPLTSTGRFPATGLDAGIFTYELGAYGLTLFQ